MELIFVRANHEVTGSCHYLYSNGKHILIDCGMEQGTDVFENIELPVSEALIDYVFLTHAHIDHSGLLPLLYARGFRGKIYATEATMNLCSIMLRDSAHIQMQEAEWKNRKAKRNKQIQVADPLYTMQDADGVIRQIIPCVYGKEIKVSDDIKIRFTDIGHLLGSASIEVWLTEQAETKKIVFSGDIGNKNQPLIRDPRYTETADYVVMESTYGDRYHTIDKVNYINELTEIIQKTFDRGGNVVIPSFAVGRTQEILYFLRKIKADRLVQGYSNFPVYVDSPLAVEATEIFQKNNQTCFDEEALELVHKGINPISFPGLRLSITSEESKAINFDDTPKVIISASGMCEAGRIRHHLKHNLWRTDSAVVFVGYQANGTLGRMILDGLKEVRLFGETVEVNASIYKIQGLSGHADKQGLLDWVNAFSQKPQKVFVVHGEDTVSEAFVQCLNTEYGHEAVAPYSGSRFNLLTNSFTLFAEPVTLKKAEGRRISDVFKRLLAAHQRLFGVIQRNEGVANKDLAKFADQINSLCDKWDR